MNRFIIFLLLISFPVMLHSGTTGKITGVVKDKETGEMLPNVNIIIEGTSQGAASDIKGDYFINNVPAGFYTVKAMMMGYTNVVTTKVKVSADLTTHLNFELPPEVLDLGESVTIVAERPLVEKDVTATTKITTAEEILKMPARTSEQVVEYTAGVLGMDVDFAGRNIGSINIRGGQDDEVAWMIDGLSVNDPLSGGRAVRMNNIAVQEIQVITGGFNAEYGQAMSGLVNVVTKTGGTTKSAAYRITTDKGTGLFSNKLDFGYWDHEFAVGGPVPFTGNKLSYFVSGALGLRGCRDPRKLDNQIAQLVNEGYDLSKFLERWPEMKDNSYYLHHNRQQRYLDTWKFQYTLGNSIKLQFGGMRERDQNELHPFAGTGLIPIRSAFWVADQYNSELRKNTQIWGGITHQIAPSTFYELKITSFSTDYYTGLKNIYRKTSDGSVARDSLGTPIIDEDFSWWEDYTFVPAKYPEGTHESTAQYGYTDYRDTDWTNPYNPFGVYNNWQGGDASTYVMETRELSYIGFKLDVTSQVTKVHQLKAGVEYWMHTASRAYAYSPWRPNPWQDHYDVEPRELAAYIQDKVELPGLIINAGIRLDYFAPNQTHRRDMLDRYSEHVETDPKVQVSPRLGIAHPITDRTHIHFMYGRFFQRPNFLNLYRYLDPLITLGTTIGNPDMDSEKTTAFELGLTHQLGLNTRLDIVAYYKDIYDLRGTRYLPTSPFPIYQDDNRDYANAKGIEFTFYKRLADNWGASVSYTLSSSKGQDFSIQADFLRQRINPETGLPYFFPEKMFPNNQTREHMFRANFDVRLQEGQGPSLFGFKPLENFGINILFKANSGWHYTRQNYRGESVEERGASVAPWYYNTDLRADRRFRLFGRTYLTAFIEIYNLFNTTHILGLHARTGDPLLVGDEREYQEANFTEGVSQGDPTWEWEKVKDRDDDGHISAHEEYEAFMKSFLFLRRTASNFGPPRLVRFGFELNLD